MPLTPFHLGPGLLLKGAVPGRLSWTAFAAANVLIDCETLYNIVARRYPLHRELHTFLGATLAGLAAAGLLIAVRRLMPRLAALAPHESEPRALLMGGLLGGVSHPLFDGLMHSDIRPFAPFSDANPLLGAVDVGLLHAGCLAAGLIGAVLVYNAWTRHDATKPAPAPEA